MNKLSSFLLCAAVAVCPLSAKPKPPLQPVNLGSAAPFAVFGAFGVTCTGTTGTVITGDLGVYPIAGTAVTGFYTDDDFTGPCKVIGNIQDNDTGPETTAGKHAYASLGLAITDALGRPCPATQIPAGCALASELGNLTITPGVYINDGVVTISSGPVYLNGPGVYIFQIAGSLQVNCGTSSACGEVVLLGGATAANVFWVTTQATLDAPTKFYGNILSTTSVTFTNTTGPTALTGRALALTNVTFAAGDTVTLPK